MKDITKEDDLHLHVFRLFYLKDQNKVIKTKLKFHEKEKSVKDIKGNLHIIRDMWKAMEVHQNESIVSTEEDKE